MSTDYSGLISLLSGGESLRKSTGMTSADIIKALRREAATPTDPLDLFKSALLTKAANMKALGSM